MLLRNRGGAFEELGSVLLRSPIRFGAPQAPQELGSVLLRSTPRSGLLRN